MQYKYDTHVHTSETSRCGKLPAREIVRLYKDKGYNGIFITDHYAGYYFDSIEGNWDEKINIYLQGYKKALDYGKKVGLNVMLGMELLLDGGANEYLIYGITEKFLTANTHLYRLSLENLKELAAKNGCLVFQAHPFRPNMVPADPLYLDGVEVYNGNPRHDSRCSYARKYAEDNNMLMLSGSDCHQEVDAGRGGIVTEKEISNVSDFIETINEKKYQLITTI